VGRPWSTVRTPLVQIAAVSETQTKNTWAPLLEMLQGPVLDEYSGLEPLDTFVNLPRGRIIKDDTLNEIVLHPPKNQDDLGKVRGLSGGWRTNDIGGRLMAALHAAKPLDQGDMPDREPRRPGLTKDAALVSDLLKLLLKVRAKESGVAARLIARSDDLEALAAGVRKNLNILQGWRFEQFGKDALDLVEGRLAFAIENGKLKMSRVRQEQQETVDA